MGGITSIFKGPPKPAPPPRAPDPAKTIQAQKEAAQITQFTPTGNVIYGQLEDGEFVRREGGDALRIEETPFQEQFRTGREDISLGLLGQLGGELPTFRDVGEIEAGLTPMTTDFADEAMRLEQETFEAAKRRLDPIVSQEREDLIQNLADRGIPLSSEAGQKELTRFDQSVADRQQDLAFGAIGVGRAEQDRLTRLTSALRGQQINEQFGLANLGQQQRAQQFGEIGALSGFAAPIQPFNAPTVDVAGITGQSYGAQLQANQLLNQQRQQRFATQQQQAGDLISTGMTAAMMFSDVRLKENVIYHSTVDNYKLYDFNYKGDDVTYRGVLAQDVIEINPDSVVVMPNGYYAVNYGDLGLEMEMVSA